MSLLNQAALDALKNRITGPFKSVTFPHQKNLFNKVDISTNFALASGGIVTIASIPWFVSNHIPVLPGARLKIGTLLASSTAGLAFFKNGTYLANSWMSNNDVNTANGRVQAPMNCDTLRISGTTNTIANFQIEYGDVDTFYEDFSPIPSQPNFARAQDVNILTYPFRTVGKNIFNKNSVLRDSILPSNGIPVGPNAGWWVSDHMTVLPNSKITVSHCTPSTSTGAAFCRNKAVISWISNTDIVANDYVISIPNNIDSIRVSSNNLADISLMQVEYGDTQTDYAEFGELYALPSFRETQTVNSNLMTYPFRTVGKNLFNKDAATLNKTLPSNGIPVGPNAGWWVSDHMTVLPNSKITVSHCTPSTSTGAAFCRNKAVISWISNTDIVANNYVISIPNNIDSIRVSSNNLADISLMQVEYGDTQTDYVEFGELYALPSFREIQTVNATVLANSYKTIGKNLFNKDAATLNKTLPSNGIPVGPNAGWWVSDHMTVLPNMKVKLSRCTLSASTGAAFYLNKAVVSWISNNDIVANGKVLVIPTGVNSIRVSSSDVTELVNMQVEVGEKQTSFEPYKETYATPPSKETQTVKILDNDYFSKPEFKKCFTSNKVDVYQWDSTKYGSLRVTFRNVAAWASTTNLYLSIEGLGGAVYDIALNSTNFPNLITGSTIEHVIAMPWSRNATTGYEGKEWRLNVITNKGQVYHNFPSRAVGSDGTELINHFRTFDESCVWELPERWTPVKTESGGDATLIATGKYKYFPALPDESYEMHPAISVDNGFGNGGFPATITKTDENGNSITFGRFYFSDRSRGTQSNPLGYMGGFEPHPKLTVLGTYKNNASNGACRICVFLTNDGGRNWFPRYEFGEQGELLDSSDNDITVDKDLFLPRNLKVTGFSAVGSGEYQVIKRSQYQPSATSKEVEKTKMFKYGTSIAISSITPNANDITIVTVSAHNLTQGDVVLFEKTNGASNAWDWIVNTGHTALSAGTGVYFKVKYVNTNTFILMEMVHNPHNNLTCRHLHTINRCKDGYIIGTGERYPNGWILFLSVRESDAFARKYPWDTLSFIRLTSTSVSVQRPLGAVLSQDADNSLYVGVDNELTDLGSIILPTGRTDTFKRSSTGVYKGKLVDVDDQSKFSCILESQEVCYFFKEINGTMIFCGQQGHVAISTNRGESWVQFKLDVAVVRFGGIATDELICIDNYVFKLKS